MRTHSLRIWITLTADFDGNTLTSASDHTLNVEHIGELVKIHEELRHVIAMIHENQDEAGF